MHDDGGALSRRTLLLGVLGAGVVAVGAGTAAEWDNPTFVRLRGGCGPNPAVPRSTYAVTHLSTTSAAMPGEQLGYSVALPAGHRPGDGTPLVVYLPGLNRGDGDLDGGLGIGGFATAAGSRLAFVQPGFGGRTYWHPRADGRDPMAALLDDVVPAVEHRFGVGGSRDRRGVFGSSMGACGSLLLVQQHPETVAAAVALSPAVFRSYAEARRGHPYTFDSERDWKRYGLWEHLDEVRGPAIRIDCGSADPFAPTARQLLKLIPGATGGIESGCHVGSFWRRRLPSTLAFLADHLSG
ncbi:MAG TPA: alpha/beta hydrolase-fold protein [Mycobacteriales bacterium]|nr:alpha/beta hydrolase-fold protein [Mycobacteriales bacterium]